MEKCRTTLIGAKWTTVWLIFVNLHIIYIVSKIKINKMKNLFIKVSLVALIFAIVPVFNAQGVTNTSDGNKVTITSPNGGETYKVGNTIHFLWDSTLSNYGTTITYINIYKLKGTVWDPNATDYNTYVDQNNPVKVAGGNTGIPDTGSYDWTVPSSLDSKPGKYVAGIFISYWNNPYANDGGIQSDWSNTAFTIGEDTTTISAPPSISKLSPTSAAIGSTVTVTGKGFLATNDVNLRNTSYGVASVTNAQVTNVSATSLKFIIPTFLPAGDFSVSVINSNGESSGMTLGVTGLPSTPHSVGTNVLGTDGTVYRIVEGNYRSPYTSAGAFLSYKFNTWATTVAANSADMAMPLSTYTPTGSSSLKTAFIPPRNGSLINDKGTVYIITGGLRAGFASESVFGADGFKFNYSNVYPGDTSFMVTLPALTAATQKHPNGTLINDNGTLYVMKDGYRVGFPSMDVLDSWGYWVSEAVTANSYDHAAQVSGVMSTRMANQLSI